MNCPKCHKPLTPISKKGRTLLYRCTNPDCGAVKVEVKHSREGETVTIISGQSNSVSKGVMP